MDHNWTMLPLMDNDRWEEVDGEKWGGREKGSGMETQREKRGGMGRRGWQEREMSHFGHKHPPVVQCQVSGIVRKPLVICRSPVSLIAVGQDSNELILRTCVPSHHNNTVFNNTFTHTF